MVDSIYLRPLKVEDASISFKWRNDADLWKYTGRRPTCVITEEIERAWAENAIADKTRLNFAICKKHSDQYIGNVYLTHINGSEGELGLFIGDRLAQGHAYGQKALKLLIVEAKRHGICRVVINVGRDNVPALITYLKCGAKLPKTWDGSGMLKLILDVR